MASIFIQKAIILSGRVESRLYYSLTSVIIKEVYKMKFKLFPVLDKMIDFYHKPRGIDRFWDYLKILKGDSKDDMEVPIPNFNPMGKEHVLIKLLELKELNIEEAIEEVLNKINKRISTNKSIDINVVISLADDLKGGWTNRYTTDYDSKFKLNAYINRNFCIPVFWTSEEYNIDIIKRRVEEYCFRTLYWKIKSRPETLEEHIKQELFVDKNCITNVNGFNLIDFSFINEYYNSNINSTEYSRIFNFMYGDNSCRELGYVEFGIKEQMAGYKYAKMKNQLIFPSN